jgi:hypothetical protein
MSDLRKSFCLLNLLGRTHFKLPVPNDYSKTPPLKKILLVYWLPNSQNVDLGLV